MLTRRLVYSLLPLLLCVHTAVVCVADSQTAVGNDPTSHLEQMRLTAITLLSALPLPPRSSSSSSPTTTATLFPFALFGRCPANWLVSSATDSVARLSSAVFPQFPSAGGTATATATAGPQSPATGGEEKFVYTLFEVDEKKGVIAINTLTFNSACVLVIGINEIVINNRAVLDIGVNSIAINTLAVLAIGINTIGINRIAVTTIAINAIAVNAIFVDRIGIDVIIIDGLAVNGITINSIGVDFINVDGITVCGIGVNEIIVNSIGVVEIAINSIAVNSIIVDTIAANVVAVNTIVLNTVGLNVIASNIYADGCYVENALVLNGVCHHDVVRNSISINGASVPIPWSSDALPFQWPQSVNFTAQNPWASVLLPELHARVPLVLAAASYRPLVARAFGAGMNTVPLGFLDLGLGAGLDLATGQLVAPVAGDYLFSAVVPTAMAQATNESWAQLVLVRNDVQVLELGPLTHFDPSHPPEPDPSAVPVIGPPKLELQARIRCAAGDRLRLDIYANTPHFPQPVYVPVPPPPPFGFPEPVASLLHAPFPLPVLPAPPTPFPLPQLFITQPPTVLLLLVAPAPLGPF